MADQRITRLLVASLHQAVAERLPTRLEFYETWLDTRKLRHESVGPAQMAAVLSFLRREAGAYDDVLTLGGTYAVDWALEAWPAGMVTLVGALPRFVRRRVALRLAGRLLRTLGAAAQVVFQGDRDGASAEVRGSIFCDRRATVAGPQCAFHRAALSQFCGRFAVPMQIELFECRALEGDVCRLRLAPAADRVDTA